MRNQKPKRNLIHIIIKSTAIIKSHGRCSCTSIVKYLAAIVVTLIAIAAFVMGQEKILNFLVVKIVQNFLYAFLYNSYTFPEVLKDW